VVFRVESLIKMGNLGRGSINLEKIEYIVGVTPSKLDKLNYADLLFNTRNTLELVGKVAIWRNELKEAYYNSNLMRIVFKKEVIATNFFVNFMLNSELMVRKLSEIAIGTTSVAAIYNRDLLKIYIPLPPLPEQKAIATALCDIDGLIASLSKLIEKKKNIKQGAMQELLTGKKRLEGFSGEWVEIKLGDIADIYQPITISNNSFTDDGYYVYGANGIVGKYDSYNHEKWQTIITCRGSTCGTVNKTVDKCWITGNAMVVNFDNIINIDKLFMYYSLSTQDFSTCVTGTGQPQIVRSPMFEFKIIIPKRIEEQTAIATILSDMDSEIEKHQAKLDKYKAIKQGMMQELLTGRIRLLKGA
jgi:type I restriction enzyme, S subunit